MEDDLKVCTTTYKESEAVKVALAGDVNFFDNFHLSPLKVGQMFPPVKLKHTFSLALSH